MQTRIDHATVITCRNGEAVVLEDTSVSFHHGMISEVTWTPNARVRPDPPGMPPLEELSGRPLGRILLKMGRVTREQLSKALERQRETPGARLGRILIEMGFVTDDDVHLAVAAKDSPERLRRIDGRNLLLIPGLVNTHHHLYQSLTRCMPSAQNATLFEWLVALYPKWRELTYDALRQAATISLAELLLGGCTTTSDHMYLFPRERDVQIEAVLEAAESLGIRIHACRGSMSLGKSAGGLPPDECTQSEDDILRDCLRAIDRFHDPQPMAMSRIDLAPCSPFSVTPGLLDQTRQLAAERNVLLHTHAAETLDEELFCMEKFGIRPIEYLHQHGWLAPNVYLAHCVHLNDEEIRQLASTSTGVAHCPCSNMRLGSGIPPIRRMMDAGVKVGIGVDGSSSNDGGNLLAEARQALLLQRVVGGVRAMSTGEAFTLATVGGASVLHRPELGRLDPGAAADLVAYDMNDIAFAGAIAQDPLGAVMLCNAARPRYVFVNGRMVVKDGEVAGIDSRKLAADFNQMVRERFR